MPSEETKKTPRKPRSEKAPAKEKASVKKEAASAKKPAALVQKKKTPSQEKKAAPAVQASQKTAPAKAAPPLNWKKIVQAAALVGVFFGVSFYFLSASPVLFTYRDVKGKQVSVRMKEALNEVRPLLAQAPQDAIDSLQKDKEAVRNVVNSISVQPRIFLLEALEISNFQESPEYQARVSNELDNIPLRIAFNKGIEEVGKVVEKETVSAADISRILFVKTGDAAEDAALLVSAKATLEALKTSTNTNMVEEFSKAAVEKSQDQATAEMGGYIGTAYQGQYPELDAALFSNKAPEGLYAEVAESSNSYNLLYVHASARAMPVKDFIEENPQAKDTFVASNINRNTELLAVIENGVLKINGKEAKAEDLTEDTPIVKYWGKTYKAKDIAKSFALVNGLGNTSPTPIDLVRSLSIPNSMYSLRMGILLKVPSQNITQSKEYKEAVSDAVKRFDNEAVGIIVQETLESQVDTNISAQDITNFYNSLPQKPVKSYTAKGEPVYATLGESVEAVKEEMVRLRYQQAFAELEKQIQQKYELAWKDENLPKFLKGLLADYKKAQKQAPAQ